MGSRGTTPPPPAVARPEAVPPGLPSGATLPRPAPPVQHQRKWHAPRAAGLWAAPSASGGAWPLAGALGAWRCTRTLEHTSHIMGCIKPLVNYFHLTCPAAGQAL